MTVRLKADGASGKVAIYTLGAGDLAFTDPLNHLSEVLFHSDLAYPTIIDTHTGSITFPARAANSFFNTSQTLFAHGRPGFPMILGQFDSLGGQAVTLAGSVPVQMESHGAARWATLGADATNVVMHEQCLTHTSAGFSAITLNYTVWILDVILQ